MASKQVITGIALAAVLAAAPARAADDQQHHRQGRQQQEHAQRAQPPARAQSREQAVPRTGPPPREYQQRGDNGRNDVRRDDGRYDSRSYQVPRQYNRGTYHAPAPYYGPRGYHVAPRVIRPSIVTVVPYRPYVYRPSWSLGVYYGSDGYYPYGYTPRQYYDPIPGRPYGGLRITGMPRDAQVFADGYFVGIVNDFDGIFQHLNLEAGPHHIEIQLPGGYDAPLAFDVYIEPGRTTTYRAAY